MTICVDNASSPSWLSFHPGHRPLLEPRGLHNPYQQGGRQHLHHQRLVVRGCTQIAGSLRFTSIEASFCNLLDCLRIVNSFHFLPWPWLTCRWDDNGHGTHVSGTAAGSIHGVAKKSTLHSVKVKHSSRVGRPGLGSSEPGLLMRHAVVGPIRRFPIPNWKAQVLMKPRPLRNLPNNPGPSTFRSLMPLAPAATPISSRAWAGEETGCHLLPSLTQSLHRLITASLPSIYPHRVSSYVSSHGIQSAVVSLSLSGTQSQTFNAALETLSSVSCTSMTCSTALCIS